MTTPKDDIELDSRHSWDVPKVRACLLCKTEFESEWSGERICKRCKGTSAWKSGMGTESVPTGRR